MLSSIFDLERINLKLVNVVKLEIALSNCVKPYYFWISTTPWKFNSKCCKDF